jgi:hypothetical protein
MLWIVKDNLLIREVEIDIMTCEEARANEPISNCSGTTAIKIPSKHIPFPIAVNAI